MGQDRTGHGTAGVGRYQLCTYLPITTYLPRIRVSLYLPSALTGSAVITHDVTTGTGYCLVGFNWIIDFLN